MKRRQFTGGLFAAGLAAPAASGQTVQRKTPGVFIIEENAFPNSVVEVATAVPAFIGYTEQAQRGAQDLWNVPTRVTSMAEFERYFGGPPATESVMILADGVPSVTERPEDRFLLYRGLQMFFKNGGGPCWIVSVGTYRDGASPVVKSAGHFLAAWDALSREAEPTMIIVPDAVLLSQPDYARVSNAALAHCADMQSRIAILDVFDGDRPRTFGDDDIISGTQGFRTVIDNNQPSYGVAYYPWLNTNLVTLTEVDPGYLTAESRAALRDLITAEQNTQNPGSPQVATLLDKLTIGFAADTTRKQTHQDLLSFSQIYRQVMDDLVKALNVMPPSTAMAGVYTRTDDTIGVFKAPANIGIVSVVSPTVEISHEEQEDLNVPLDGKAINAIRTFLGRGVLVWGARTLDGNSQDFRYVNVRRTLIMLEQSIKSASEAYVFAPNDAGTWQTVKTMLENFLNNQWKAGALAGAKPADAYDVSVGLGSTMTANDILDGYMRVTVRVAIVRPAEFIVLTFQQKMQSE